MVRRESGMQINKSSKNFPGKKQQSYSKSRNFSGVQARQGFWDWGTCTPTGTFAYLKG